MTREEAIKNIKEHCYFANLIPPAKEALDMAIKALEQDPCGDCISREAVLKAIDAKAWEFCDYLISKGRNDEQKPVSHFADNLRECVGEDLPSVTAQPKMGRWKRINKEKYVQHAMSYYRCSECGEEIIGKHNYCPMCGCKMQEVKDEKRNNILH